MVDTTDTSYKAPGIKEPNAMHGALFLQHTESMVNMICYVLVCARVTFTNQEAIPQRLGLYKHIQITHQ